MQRYLEKYLDLELSCIRQIKVQSMGKICNVIE